MSRPLRIEYPDAWYHIMNRGRRHERIFSDPEDYHIFLDILKDAGEMWNLRVAAYCLMPNHYHLLVQTPDANISRSMRHINGVYTQAYNRRHKLDGPLFRGRYKSLLVSADDYLLKLMCYIHKNPLKAGLVKNLKDYKWSSHKGYVSAAGKWDWLEKGFILSMLTPDRRKRITEYKKFMRTGVDEVVASALDGTRRPVCLGPDDFVDWVKGAYRAGKTDDEVPDAKLLAPDVSLIMECVCAYYKIDAKTIFISRRGISNEPRNVAVYLCRRMRGDRLTDIRDCFHMRKYSSVSSIIERVKAGIKADKKFRKRVDEIGENIKKSQEQT